MKTSSPLQHKSTASVRGHILVLSSLLFACQAVHAASVTWNSTVTSGSWDSTANWFTTTVPTVSSTAYFLNTASAATITLSGSSAAQGVVVNNTSATAFSSGTLTLGSGGLTVSSGAGAVTLGSTIALASSQTWTSGTSVVYNAVTTGSNLGAVTLTFSGGAYSAQYNTTSYFSEGSGSSLSILVDGGSSITSTKTGVNVFSGGLWVKNGSISFYNGSFGSGTITLGDTSTSSGTASIAVNNTTTIANNIVVQGGGTSIIREGDSSGTHVQTYTGTITLNNTAALQLQGPSTSSGSIVFSGPIVGSGGLAVNVRLNATLSGINTFSGGVSVTSGLLNIGSAWALGSGTLTLNSGSIDNKTGSSLTLATDNVQAWNGGFTFVGTNDLNLGTGAVSLGSASRTVTVTANTLAVGGAISGGAASAGLTKSGAGTLLLAGANTYTGVTTINTGTLQLGNGSTGSLTSGTVSVASGAAFVLNQGDGGSYAGTVSNNGTVYAASAKRNTFAGVVAGAGAFNQVGSGTTILTAANTYTGATTISAGELDVNGSTHASSAVSILSGGALGGTGTVNGTVTGVDATVKGSGLKIAGAASFSGNSTLSGTNTFSAGVTASSGILSVTGLTTTNNSALSVSAAATLVNSGTVKGDVDVLGTYRGSGTVNGALTIESGATFTVGASTVSSLSVKSGALVSLTLDSLASYNHITATNSVTLSGGTLDLTLGTTLGTYVLIDNEGASLISGTFGTVTLGGSTVTIADSTSTSTTFTYGSLIYELNYTGGTGNDLTLTVVPEPGTWAMVLSGFGCLVGLQHLRRKNA